MWHVAFVTVTVVFLVKYASSICTHCKLNRGRKNIRSLRDYVAPNASIASVAILPPQALFTPPPYKPNLYVHEFHQDPKGRGAVICAGSTMYMDAKAVIDQLRNIWNSSLPVAIMHCNELNKNRQNKLLNTTTNIQFIDICKKKSLFGMDHEVMLKRLRSWWCKSASILLAPFEEVLIMDEDVIWTKSPNNLFNYPKYQEKGLLFFRDRFTSDNSFPETQWLQHTILKFLQQYNPSLKISSEYAKQRMLMTGMNYFWKYYIKRDFSSLNNIQDSSVILINKSKSSKFLDVLSQLIPFFNVGYGDKEIYWISAEIAGVPYTFEPFINTQYGDCGVLMHYDPNHMNHPNNVDVLYINAGNQKILRNMTSIGLALRNEMPLPQLALENTTIYDLDDKKYIRGRFHRCACEITGCQPMPTFINNLVLRTQWERSTRDILRDTNFKWPKIKPTQFTHSNHSRTKGQHNSNTTHFILLENYNLNIYKREQIKIELSKLELIHIIDQIIPRCIPISPNSTQIISQNVNQFIKRNECLTLGCSFTPIPIRHQAIQRKKAICVPISFQSIPSEELKYLTMLMQTPLAVNRLGQKDKRYSRDEPLHAVPSL